jgi:hypothetical protein
MIARLRPHLIHHRGIFGDLRLFQTFLPALKQRAGIGHRIIQPQTIEIIAQIIVIADVLARLFLGVRPQEMPQPFKGAHKDHAGITVKNRVIIGMDQIHKGHQIRRAPPPVQIGVAEPQITLADQPAKAIGIVDMQLGHRAGIFAFGAEDPTIGQHDIQPPIGQALRHRKAARKIARQVGLVVCSRQDHPRLHVAVRLLIHAGWPAQVSL